MGRGGIDPNPNRGARVELLRPRRPQKGLNADVVPSVHRVAELEPASPSLAQIAPHLASQEDSVSENVADPPVAPEREGWCAEREKRCREKIAGAVVEKDDRCNRGEPEEKRSAEKHANNVVSAKDRPARYLLHE